MPTRYALMTKSFSRAALILALSFFASPGFTEGLLPPTQAEAKAAKVPQTGPLHIGENVLDTLTITNLKGSVRTLISYKEPLDVLVVGFFSSRCEAQTAQWTAWKHFYADYQDWRVEFVGIQSDPTEDLTELSKQMTKAGLPFTVLPDPDHTVAKALGATYSPELVIIDESRTLRYRGPLGKEARQAIEAVIGHVDPVTTPEPVAADVKGCPIQ